MGRYVRGINKVNMNDIFNNLIKVYNKPRLNSQQMNVKKLLKNVIFQSRMIEIW